MGCCIKFYKSLFKRLIQFQDRCCVVAPVAVIRRRPYCHQLLVEHLLVALHYQLVGSADQANLIVMVELLDDVPTEEVACTTWA